MALRRLSSPKVWDPSRVNHPGYADAQPFAQGTWAPAGPVVFVSGQVALDRDGEVVGAGDIRAQTRQALANLVAILEAAGATLPDVAKLTVYVTDMGQFPGVQEVRGEFWSGLPLPASTALEVRRLVREEFMVEIEAIAVLGA